MTTIDLLANERKILIHAEELVHLVEQPFADLGALRKKAVRIRNQLRQHCQDMKTCLEKQAVIRRRFQ